MPHKSACVPVKIAISVRWQRLQVEPDTGKQLGDLDPLQHNLSDSTAALSQVGALKTQQQT